MSYTQSYKTQFLKRFGKRIANTRKRLEISQDELADLAEIQRSYMGKIERGESNPPIFTVHKIIHALEERMPELPLKWRYYSESTNDKNLDK